VHSSCRELTLQEYVVLLLQQQLPQQLLLEQKRIAGKYDKQITSRPWCFSRKGQTVVHHHPRLRPL